MRGFNDIMHWQMMITLISTELLDHFRQQSVVFSARVQRYIRPDGDTDTLPGVVLICLDVLDGNDPHNTGSNSAKFNQQRLYMVMDVVCTYKPPPARRKKTTIRSPSGN